MFIHMHTYKTDRRPSHPAHSLLCILEFFFDFHLVCWAIWYVRPAESRTGDLESILAFFGFRDRNKGVGGTAREINGDTSIRTVPALGSVFVQLLRVVAKRALFCSSVPLVERSTCGFSCSHYPRKLHIPKIIGRLVLVTFLSSLSEEAEFVGIAGTTS